MSAPTPTAKEITDICKSHGFLAKQLYAIFTTPANGLGPVMEVLQRHLAYQVSLTERGIMFAAGPHWTDDEQLWGGDGMVVVRAASREEAEKIAQEDPMHSSGARQYRIRPWLINEGTITVKLDYTTGRFQLD